MVKVQRFYTKNKRRIILLLTILLLLAEFFHYSVSNDLIYQIIMGIAGIIGIVPIFLTAISALKTKVISIDVLVTIAVIGAFIIKEFNEAAIVTWLFMLGEVLEEMTLQKTRSAVTSLTKISPTTATVINDDNTIEEKDIDSISKGNRVLVKAGSRVPVDGEILEGDGHLNEAPITGESKLIFKTKGASVYTGSLLDDGSITIKTISVGDETIFGKIIEMVENAEDSQTKVQKFIDHFSQYYTPAVLVIAVLVGIFSRDFRLAITIMVLGCPGALVIGVPVSTVAGIGRGAKRGILFKGSEVMDQIKKVDLIAFDKTGTLTVGYPEVTAIKVLKGDKTEIIDRAVTIEKQSNHPLAKAVAKLDTSRQFKPTKVKTIKGKGMQAVIDGNEYLLGSLSMMEESNLQSKQLKETVNQLTSKGNSIVIFASLDHSQLAIFGIQDHLRPQASQALKELQSLGVKQRIMLTGDDRMTAEKIAAQLPLTNFHANLLPEDKVELIKQYQQQGYHVAFVGDGINDSPALSQADVAIAMGSGTDVAIDVSDVVLVKSNLKSLVNSFKLARLTLTNMRENIMIALLTVLFLFAGLFIGKIGIASGMLVHELSILVVILNAMRLVIFSAKN